MTAPRFSDASLCPVGVNRFASSVDAGWTSVLLEHHRAQGKLEYRPRVTPDQTIFVLTRGRMTLTRQGEGTAIHEVGSAGLTAAGRSTRLEIAAEEPIELATLFVPHGFFEEADEHYRRAGSAPASMPLDAIGFHDPTITSAVAALLRAMAAREPDLYAESVAQWLATHMLSRHATWRSTERRPGEIAERRLARVVEYMTIHFAEPLSLDRLAREAGISKFHFARLFRERKGVTPHAYLVALRMDAACRMLASTDLTVSEIAAACGYDGPAHFGASFQRRHGVSPLGFRARSRS